MPQFASFATGLENSMSESLRTAVRQAETPALDGGPRNQTLVQWLQRGLDSDALDVPEPARMACLSGLWLLAGEIDRSHSISQDLPSREGSFLHGIMHRREGDFGNAKYWFRRVGDHCLFEQLRRETNGVYRDPFDFVDACQHASAENVEALKTAQWIEWQALMQYIIDQA